MAQTHWKKLTNPDYIGAYSIEDGKDLILTIKKVVQESVTGADGKKEDCIVCYWQENQKPMILNVTNCKMIAKLANSPYIEQWAGIKVQIGVEKVKAFGDVVDALRIRKTKPKVDAGEKPIICDECGKTIQPAYGMSAAKWVEYSKGKLKTDKCLCADCAAKLNAASSNVEASK